MVFVLQTISNPFCVSLQLKLNFHTQIMWKPFKVIGGESDKVVKNKPDSAHPEQRKEQGFPRSFCISNHEF